MVSYYIAQCSNYTRPCSCDRERERVCASHYFCLLCCVRLCCPVLGCPLQNPISSCAWPRIDLILVPSGSQPSRVKIPNGNHFEGCMTQASDNQQHVTKARWEWIVSFTKRRCHRCHWCPPRDYATRLAFSWHCTRWLTQSGEIVQPSLLVLEIVWQARGWFRILEMKHAAQSQDCSNSQTVQTRDTNFPRLVDVAAFN